MKIYEIWKSIIAKLPRQPRSYNTKENPGFWTNGEEILCPSEMEMQIVCSFLEDIFGTEENYNLITGWYDPFEDAESGEIDDCTGFNYIRLE